MSEDDGAQRPVEVAALVARLRAREALVGILGMGYVGLPLAREFCEAGFRVLGFDTDPKKVAALSAGQSYIQAVSSEDVARFTASGALAATSELGRLGEPDALVICVPTPLDKHREPDLQYVEATGRAIAGCLRAGQLVVLESTTYPGTTDELLKPILEAGGHAVGVDVFLGYSPERENPGDAQWRTRDIPKVVGADDEASRALTAALYEGVVARVVPVSTSRAAEASKLLENIYRCVNIALVNELKVLFERMGIDVFEVIEASKTKPFGFKAFYPGPGLGGHCLDGGERIVARRRAGDGAGAVCGPTLAELFGELREPLALGDVEVGWRDDLEVLSLDTQSQQPCWRPARWLFRRPSKEPRLRLEFAEGLRLTVSSGHPMLVQSELGTAIKRADTLCAGDRVPWLPRANPRADLAPLGEASAPVAVGLVTELAFLRAVPVEAGLIYSIEVEATHTFVTTGGVAVHNCIPVDPFYLSWKAREYGQPTRFIELAGEVNAAMPEYVVQRCLGALNDERKALRGARVLVLGLAYKENVDDIRESPALSIVPALAALGAELCYHDPHVPRGPNSRKADLSHMESVPLTAERLREQDLVLILTAHEAVDYALVARESALVVDSRNALARVTGERRARIVRA